MKEVVELHSVVFPLEFLRIINHIFSIRTQRRKRRSVIKVFVILNLTQLFLKYIARYFYYIELYILYCR